MKMVSAILAGGLNTRFPMLKSFIRVDGRPIVERNLALLRSACERVYISTNEPEHYFYLGVPLVGDIIKDSGPMGGIVSLFLASGARHLFVSACDMPFIHIEVIKYIIENSSGQATVPVIGGRPEPLLAVYSNEAAELMHQRLSEGKGSLWRILRELDVQYIEEGDLKRLDPSGESFTNINTPEDYERAFGSRPSAVNIKEA